MSDAPKFDNGKRSASSIKELETIEAGDLKSLNRSAIFKLEHLNVKHDLALFLNAKQNQRLFVFFSGAADRKIFTLPVFHRWSWHNQFPGHSMYISDPTLKRSADLPLGWYIGDNAADLNEGLRDIILSVAHNIGLTEEDIVFYGSSGGGFAALRALSIMPRAKAIVINPQTKLSSFVGNGLSRYLGEFFPGNSVEEFSRLFPDRNSVEHRVGTIEGSRIVYAQCLEDEHHMTRHLSELFVSVDGVFKPKVLKNCSLVFFNDPRGHIYGEPNELVPVLLSKLDIDGSDVLNSGISA